MMRFFVLNLLLCQLYAITGYLYEYEVTDCQDACSQYAIHHEVQDTEPINIIFDDSMTNIDLYVNRYVEVDLGQEIFCVECSAFQVQDISLSDGCEYIVDCFQDPCITYECDVNPNLECLPNFCGGCYADFYDLEGNLVNCNSSVNDCIDLSGIPFPECGSVIGFGYVEGECQTMYCSPIDGYGVDWSNWIYNTIEECEEVCGTNNPITLGDINFDGAINILDVDLLVSFILGEPTDEYVHTAANVNGDSQLDVFDALLLIDMIFNPQLPNECYIAPEVGPCDGICPTYYYNQSTNECEEFITGCCGVEVFNTLQACQNTCE